MEKYTLIENNYHILIKPEIRLNQGKLIMLDNESVTLETESIIGGHDATHPLISTFFDKLQLHTRSASAANECMVVGFTLSIIDQFEKDFRARQINSIEDEAKRIKYLFNINIDNLAKLDLENLLNIFKLSRTLGKIIKHEDCYINSWSNEVYQLHLGWFNDTNDDMDFQMTSHSENEELYFKNEEIINKIISKIKAYIDILPENLK